jgi:F-type H+-transporting ATPase subunit c
MSLNSSMKRASAALAGAAVFLAPLAAMAAEGAEKVGSNENDMKMAAYIGAGIAVALGVLGGTLGQGRAAAAALEGIARNPGAASKIQTPMILGLALIESLVLLAFLIAFFLQGK